jgi:two-component system, OmpR family, heavy metal sensor histidine kinase CusS
MIKSLATRLAVLYGLSAFGLLVVSSLILYWSLARTLEIQDEEILADRIRTVHLLAQNQDTRIEQLRERIETEWSRRKYERIFARIIDENGNVLTETPGLEKQEPELYQFFMQNETDTKFLKKDIEANGSVFKFYSEILDLGATSGLRYSVKLALDVTRERDLMNKCRQILGGIFLLGLLITLFFAYNVARKGIQPIREISKIAERISSTSLDERLKPDRFPIEFAQLAHTLNEMLDRLKDSFQRISQFSSDIAHDLRTPLSNLEGELSLALTKKRTPAEYEQTLGSGLEECERLRRILESLTFISRAENPRNVIRKEKMSVKKELQAIRDFYENSALDANIKLEIESPENLIVMADKTLFQRAVGNLISNAIQYSHAGSAVRLVASKSNGMTIVSVIDQGEGIPAEHLGRVFDRLYRVDVSRTQRNGTAVGLGLGLSIVKSIASLHDGSVAIESEIGKGTAVAIRFPGELASD